MSQTPSARRARFASLAVASRGALSLTLLLVLAACGGGGGSGNSASPVTTAAADGAAAASSTSTVSWATALSAARAGDDSKVLAVVAAVAPTDRPANAAEAARFLTQASFGPTTDEVEFLTKLGYSRWVDYQLALPATSHRAYWEAADAALKAVTPTATAGQDQVWESFWLQSSTGRDQLRQRVVFALSEIFVVSAIDGNVGGQPRAMAAWLDMLGDKGLSTYRELLENVSLHPLMGLYLTSLHNQKQDTTTGRVPDENYAREVMQLFSIGLSQLNADGTPVLVGGKQVDTYGPSDISNMARVFTGWSYACNATNSNCFYNGTNGTYSDPDRYFKR